MYSNNNASVVTVCLSRPLMLVVVSSGVRCYIKLLVVINAILS